MSGLCMYTIALCFYSLHDPRYRGLPRHLGWELLPSGLECGGFPEVNPWSEHSTGFAHSGIGVELVSEGNQATALKCMNAGCNIRSLGVIETISQYPEHLHPNTGLSPYPSHVRSYTSDNNGPPFSSQSRRYQGALDYCFIICRIRILAHHLSPCSN